MLKWDFADSKHDIDFREYINLDNIKAEGYTTVKVDLKIDHFLPTLMGGQRLHKKIISDQKLAGINLLHITGYCFDIFYKRNKFDGFSLHRDFDRPALIDLRKPGSFTWYQEEKVHRVAGPAYIYLEQIGPHFYQEWSQNDKWHRTDGPATITFNGKSWYKNHKLHRLDGPAIENWNGSHRYFIEGKEYNYAEFNKISGRNSSGDGSV